MDPGGFASKLLTGSITFTGITAVFITVVTFVAFTSDVMGGNSRRTFVGAVVVLFVVCIVVASIFMFPDVPGRIYDFINRLGYR